MLQFTFESPTLFEPDAVPAAREMLHDDTREKSYRLAKIRKFAHWLVAEMGRAGIVAKGLAVDGDGWVFEVPAAEGFVMCVVSNLDGMEQQIGVMVTEIGGASEGVDRAVETLLRNSGKVAGLKAW